jgi:hypothetical protein
MYICAESKARWQVITDHDESHKNDATKEESPLFLLISFAIVQALKKKKKFIKKQRKLCSELLPFTHDDEIYTTVVLFLD